MIHILIYALRCGKHYPRLGGKHQTVNGLITPDDNGASVHDAFTRLPL